MDCFEKAVSLFVFLIHCQTEFSLLSSQQEDTLANIIVSGLIGLLRK